jgi:hypothetical protein
MLSRETEIPSQRGHEYSNIHVEGGKNIIGNAYYFGGFTKMAIKRETDPQLGPDSPLNRIPYAIEAPFNSYYRQDEPRCLPYTRVDVLDEIYNWAEEQDQRCIFWLTGLAGTGKSTIACTVARKYYDQKRLGASFFFSRGSGDVGNARLFVMSIAVQLANDVPPLQEHICTAITERSDIATRSLSDQWRQLVLGPLSKLNDDSCASSYVLVVDALDECDDDKSIQIILQLLAEARLLKTVRLRVFLTSRPEISIQRCFNQLPKTEHQDFILHSISTATLDHDISLYLEDRLRLVCQECALEAGWPGEQVIRNLVQRANGLFIWAATACRFIREGGKRRVIRNRLSTILKPSSPVTEPNKPEEHLHEIYITVLRHSIPAKWSDEEKEESLGILRNILGSIVVLLSTLSTHSLSRLLELQKEDIDDTLEGLHAILDVPGDPTIPLRLHHPSFRDFLLDKNRCRNSNFWVDGKQAHRTLAARCMKLMSASLKQFVCGVGSPGVLATSIESSRVEQCLPLEVQYACLYWVEHLQKGNTQLRDNDQVHQFLEEHLLHWLEALGWMRRVPDGIYAITSLESIALVGQLSSYLGMTS